MKYGSLDEQQWCVKTLSTTYNMKINEIEAGEKIPFRKDTSSGSNAPPTPEEMENAFEIVKNKCSQSLSAMAKAKKFMFRGIPMKGNDATPIMFHGRSRENRMPMSTNENISAILDDGLKASGFKAIRSNSIFCTSNESFASYYGSLYYIFPVDGFAFTWNKNYQDFYVDYMYGAFVKSKLSPEEKQEALMKFKIQAQYPEFAASYGFTNKNLVKALETNHEIMVSGEYIALYKADFKQFISKIFQ
jgi:hypothetical protein